MKKIALIIMIAVLGTACATAPPPVQDERSTDPNRILDKTWQWISTITPVEKIVAANPESYTIHLSSEGRIKAQFDCNGGGGDYKISDGKLAFGPMFSTRMACPEGTQDYLFMRDLQRVRSFFLQGGELYLELPMDSGTMRFREANG